MKRFLIGAAVAMCAGTLPRPTLLGIELGKPLILPDCPKDFGPIMHLCLPPEAPDASGMVMPWMPTDGSTPEYLKGDPLVTMRDGERPITETLSANKFVLSLNDFTELARKTGFLVISKEELNRLFGNGNEC